MLAIVVLLFCFLCLSQHAHASDFGELVVNGTAQPSGALHLVGPEWQRNFIGISDSGRRLTLSGGGGLQVAKTGTVGPSVFYQWHLLGKQLSYTVDLSRVGCSCNAALYFISMPGFNASSSEPDPRGNFYCGANAGKPSINTSAAGGRGNYCPELDVLEANRFAAQSTPHICNGTNRGSGFYPMCDWYGRSLVLFLCSLEMDHVQL